MTDTPYAAVVRVTGSESMSGNIDNRKVIAVICIILAFASVCVMLYQIKIYKMFGAYTAAVNLQPSVSWVNGAEAKPVSATDAANVTAKGETYILNTKSCKIHKPDCPYIANTDPKNKQVIVSENIDEYYIIGYTSCSKCLP